MYEFDLHLGKEQNVDFILGEDVVMQISENLKGTFCTLFSDNLCNSSLLINKLFEENFYAVGTVRSNRKPTPKTSKWHQNSKKRFGFSVLKNVICCKWFGNKSALLLARNIEEMYGMSNVMRRTKSSATKTPVRAQM